MQDNLEEKFPLVDEQGKVVGAATRGECHNGSRLLHPVVHLHVFNSRGEVYLQKRPAWKDIQPGKWDTAVGGHVSYGETILEALYRETSEELGLTAFNPIGLGAYIWQTQRDNEYVFVHAILGHPTLHPNAEEVSEGRWWTFEELDRAMGQNVLTPNFENEFGRIRKQLQAML
jgi:isopentenyldiphosphate isomerase